jgi:polysaccharide export outer membrane protein
VVRWLRSFLLPCLFVSAAVIAAGQQPPSGTPLAGSPTVAVDDSLLIGPGDRVTVHVLSAPELDQQHLRVTDTGEIPLMLLGATKISGLTPADAGKMIAASYITRHFLRDAHVQVTIEEYGASEVTIFGYVVGPSITTQTNGQAIPLSAPKPLLTVLSMAGGLSEHSSRTITIQRRDHSIKPFSVYLPNNPEEALANDTLVYPGDIIMVPRSGIVYLLGNVGHPTGVYMNEDGKISLMEALTQAGGPMTTAALRNVMVFRKNGSQYAPALTVNVGKITKGTEPDISLNAEDVVWVGFSYGKNLLINGAEIAAAVGSATATGIIYAH